MLELELELERAVGSSCRRCSRTGPLHPSRNRSGPNQDLDSRQREPRQCFTLPVRRVFRPFLCLQGYTTLASIVCLYIGGSHADAQVSVHFSQAPLSTLAGFRPP